MLVPMNLIIFLFIVVPLFIGCILLQIYLSKKESPWLGLILPGLSLLSSLFCVIGMFTINTYLNHHFVKPTSGMFISILVVFIFTNIPTLILWVIYSVNRQGFKKRKEIDKMNIQDLD
ncbi:MAG: hypothetical protein ACOWWR_06490 [Eubacteriales bacterium]